MKVINILSLACLASLTSAGSPCGKDKLPNVANAISKFCSNQNIVVPSTYAIQGASGAFDRGHVSISGTCSPAQWVPKEYCLSQFKMMCSNGRRVRKFGRNGCQTWKIRYPRALPKQGGGGGGGGAAPAPAPKPAAPKSQTVHL